MGIQSDAHAHDHQGETGNPRGSKAYYKRHEEDVEKTGHFAQRFDIAQFVGFYVELFDDKVIEQCELHTKENPNAGNG